MTLAITNTVPAMYMETTGVPLSSYTSAGMTVYLGQQIMNGLNGDLYVCTNAANQAALIWSKVPPTRLFNVPTFNSVTTAAQLSTTRDARVSYVFNGTLTISVIAGQSITATLRYADDIGMSTNVVTVDVDSNSINLGLTLVDTRAYKLSGIIPAGKYRQVTFSVSGASAPNALEVGREVLD